MRLIPNWRSVLLRAHSMRAFILSLICLLMPEIIFWAWSVDTDPRLWWFGGVVLLVYGIVGRLWDQGFDRDTFRSAGSVTVAAFLLVAVPLVSGWEGKRNNAYADIVGVPTICYGHTQGVSLGDYKTDAECDAILKADLLEYREGLHRYFTPATLHGRLTPERDAAFVSLAINVGVGGAGRSTAVKRLNRGQIASACQAITWWNKAGGRVIRGLVRRRADEYRYCMKGLA